jgi:hypothetical protein
MKQMELGLEGGESQLQKYIAEGKELRKAGRAKSEASSRPISSATDSPKLFDVISPKGGGSAGGDKKALKPSYKKGGKVSSASKRADGCCVKGKTKGRMV